MSTAATTSDAGDARFTMICVRCDRPVIARAGWAGREVHCPHCLSVIRVPATPPAAGEFVRADGPDVRAKQQFNFACPRCGSVLEAHTGMSGQNGTCPTCNARMQVPFLDSGSHHPSPATLIEGEVIDPQPLHAYAASGEQAPQIHRGENDELLIECPRCGGLNPIDVDACRGCATPFTMDAAATVGKSVRDSRAIASLVFGVVGVPLFPTFVPALMALLFGGLAVFSPAGAGVSGTAIAGLVLGLFSIVGGFVFWATR